MNIMLDLNVILDVVQKRHIHYPASARVLDYALKNGNGCIAAHAVTTLHYLTNRHTTRQQADDLVDWLLQNFTIVAINTTIFLRARVLNFADFAPPTTCACAEQQRCDYIITRNCRDFNHATVAVLTPGEFITHHVGQQPHL